MKNAIAAYHWFVRQAITGARFVVRKPTEDPGQRLSAEELGILADQLARARDSAEVALLRGRLARGFYGI